MVDEVPELTGGTGRRRRLLPPRAVVYFGLALCLFSSSGSAGPPGYRVVLRTLAERLGPHQSPPAPGPRPLP
ncbi:transposase domain-containing protein [Streptomyces wedmorensis]|uniref:transposase domain-containing protein n=1 Tax=Streptomyces wedmorensis TaxID=43759 RepID=UPI0037897956